MRRAKIVCTLGPATSSYEQIRQLIESGMNVARLNMSHGDHGVHAESYANVRRAARELNRGVGIVADLQGPKIRLGRFADGPVMLEDGAEFTITTEDILGDVTQCGTTHKGLPGDCEARRHAPARRRQGEARGRRGGRPPRCARAWSRAAASGQQGHQPARRRRVACRPSPRRTSDDLLGRCGSASTWCRLSFVRSAADVEDVHAIMDEMGRRIPVIAKVEKPQAIENLAGIVEAFDGVMVARGDLGVEMPPEEVPIVQKLDRRCAAIASKPVIVATQMLESMMENTRPTRAEASDVANAVLDGADAVMLSGETALVHDDLIEWVRRSVVGRDAVIRTPNGALPKRYFDYTASGLPFAPIEDLVREQRAAVDGQHAHRGERHRRLHDRAL
jgi:pyruvate kinase